MAGVFISVLTLFPVTHILECCCCGHKRDSIEKMPLEKAPSEKSLSDENTEFWGAKATAVQRHNFFTTIFSPFFLFFVHVSTIWRSG